MGDRTSVQITIGGDLPRELAEDFLASLNNDGLGVDWDRQSESDLTPAEEGGSLVFNGHEINYACLDETEAFCKEHGLPFVTEWDAGGGFGPGLKVWTPEAGEREYDSTAIGDGARMAASTAERLGTFEAVMAWFEAAAYSPPAFRLTDAEA